MSQLRFRPRLFEILRREFTGYNSTSLRRDLLAGITVGAVGLPLALAFGVASGADAAAGLVTAILAGVIIGGLGGASFQISGPTGAMSAVLIVLAQRYGLGGIWTASLLAGLFMLMLGLFRLGRYISFIPSPVIAGFTSGIALIIAIGQLDNVLGVQTPPAENALAKLLGYFSHPVMPDWRALVLAGVVVVSMLVMPRLTRAIPGSLVGLMLAAPLAYFAGWTVPVIGDIPRTILLDQRLTFDAIPWGQLNNLLLPAVSIAALGAIESLLCGSVGATMSGKPLDSNQELIAQGIGNLIIPFFGGVPATAAIARTSVAIKSGAVTRLTSIIHAVGLLLSALVLAPLIGHIPLAALGGVLLVTAWRMNEWESIHFFFNARLKHALAGFAVTMFATAALDLTQAIMIGIAISALIYLRQSATSTAVTHEPIDAAKIQAQGFPITATCPSIHVYYLTGPLFFGSVTTVLEAFETAGDYHSLIVSMRGVPLLDAMGVQAIRQIVEEHRARGGEVSFTALQPTVMDMFQRTGLVELIDPKHIYWSATDAIVELHERRMVAGCPRCDTSGGTCAVLRQARERLAREAEPKRTLAPGSAD
ncbi:MAG: SulP family inorganic anion transporter [Chloroflexales bacterium]|nr:SulP family inorganic anion transporter [Chloroflexales bacterium]